MCAKKNTNEKEEFSMGTFKKRTFGLTKQKTWMEHAQPAQRDIGKRPSKLKCGVRPEKKWSSGGESPPKGLGRKKSGQESTLRHNSADHYIHGTGRRREIKARGPGQKEKMSITRNHRGVKLFVGGGKSFVKRKRTSCEGKKRVGWGKVRTQG